MKLILPAPASSSPPAHVVAVCVNVEPTGNLSLVETLNVPACPGCARASPFTASITGLLVVPEQFVQARIPAARHRRRVHRRVRRVRRYATGTVITTGPLVPDAISPPDSSPHWPDSQSVPPVAVIAPLVVLPGNTSLTLIAAVVGPFATAIVIV